MEERKKPDSLEPPPDSLEVPKKGAGVAGGSTGDVGTRDEQENEYKPG